MITPSLGGHITYILRTIVQDINVQYSMDLFDFSVQQTVLKETN